MILREHEIPKKIKNNLKVLPNLITIDIKGETKKYCLTVHEYINLTPNLICVGYCPDDSIGISHCDVWWLEDKNGESINLKPNTTKQTINNAFNRMVEIYHENNIKVYKKNVDDLTQYDQLFCINLKQNIQPKNK